MPELPEVETTRRGIAPLLIGHTVAGVELRTPKLRWPLDPGLAEQLKTRQVLGVRRRAKYLLLEFENGCLLLHLGMSGSLRVIPSQMPAGPHDHVDIRFVGDQSLRLTDPRKFGAVLWVGDKPEEHPLLRSLGPEPLDKAMNGGYLFRCSRQRRLAVKAFIMDQKVVVGIGNIYASEALFRAGVRPDRPAGKIGAARFGRLADEIKAVLKEAIAAGGTTLQDFQQADGRPGYFRQKLKVYGRGGEPCPVCGGDILVKTIGQRSTFFCRFCQR